MRPAISPDGTRIAFILRNDFTIGGAIGVMQLEGADRSRDFWPILHSFSSVRWTADGTACCTTPG